MCHYEKNNPKNKRSYLKVIVQTATEVHLSERHVRQFGMKKHSELSADVQRRPPGHGLLLSRDVDIILVEFPQVFLQRQTHPGPHHIRPGGIASSHSSSTHSPSQTVWEENKLQMHCFNKCSRIL